MAKTNSNTDAQGNTAQNFTLDYRRDHPKARSSYGVAGNPGIVVFDQGLFEGSDQPGWMPPAQIVMSVALVQPKLDNKAAKAEAAAARAAEKAAKAEARAAAAQEKIAAKAAKAAEALAKAQAKVTAATAVS